MLFFLIQIYKIVISVRYDNIADNYVIYFVLMFLRYINALYVFNTLSIHAISR